MAEQKITSFLTSEEIFDLGDRLQKLGLFVVDPRHLIQAHHVQDLLVALQVAGEKLTIERLKTTLAPIFCGTPEQQNVFYSFFEDWIKRQPQIIQRFNFEVTEIAPEAPIRQKVKEWVEQPKRSWLPISAVLLVAIIVITWLILSILRPPQPKVSLQSMTITGKLIDGEDRTPVSNARIFWRQDTTLKTNADGCFDFTITNQDTSARLNVRHDDYLSPSFVINFNRVQDTLSVNDTLTMAIFKIKTIPLQPLVQEEEKKPAVDSLIALVDRINDFAARQAIPPKLKPWHKFVHQYFPWLRLGGFALPLIIFIGWLVVRWLRRRIILERLATTRERKTESVTVKGKADYLYRNALFRRMVQRYRLHREEPSADLDVPATVEATIRQGGLFLPRYAFRNVLPEYLALIDRTSFSDQHAAMLDSLIQRMRSDGVVVDRYYFDDDPRICQADKPEVPHVTLQELLARHSQHRLLIFSDAEHFIDVRTGKPQSYLEQFLAWSDPAIFIPDKSEGAEYLELTLKDLGFHIGPANLNGLTRHINALHFPMATEQARWQRQPFPALLQDRPDIWLERQPPDAMQIELLIRQLNTYLGADAMTWLCACAVYPELHWELTLYLATRLNLAEDTFPGDEQQEQLQRQLLDLTRLPWFRYGVMPDWLRLRLITELNPQQHQAVRRELRALLESARQEATDGFKLEFVRRTPADPLADLVTQLSHQLGFYRDESPLHDYIFSNYISAGKSGILSVLIPEKVRRYFFHSGQVMLGVRPIAVALIMLLFSFIMLPGMSLIKSSLPQPFIVPTFQIDKQVNSYGIQTSIGKSDSTVSFYVEGGLKTAKQISMFDNFSNSFQRYRNWLKNILKDSIPFNESLFTFAPKLPGSALIIDPTWREADSLRYMHLILVQYAKVFRYIQKTLSKNDVKLMLKKYDFYCSNNDRSKDYSNPGGSGFRNVFRSDVLIFDSTSRVIRKSGLYGSEAQTYIDSLNKTKFEGYEDWRLPTLEEYKSLSERNIESLVVYDMASELMWQQAGSAQVLKWNQIQAYIDSLNQFKFAGYDDWRLPTLEEAMSLIETKANSAVLHINESFDSQQRRIWTADQVQGESWAWVVYFGNGFCGCYYFSTSNYVRAVRSGQSSGG